MDFIIQMKTKRLLDQILDRFRDLAQRTWGNLPVEYQCCLAEEVWQLLDLACISHFPEEKYH